MALVQRLVLDVLKPRKPSSLNFAMQALDGQVNCSLKLQVEEVDDKTETLMVEIKGNSIDFDVLSESISRLGGSVHSIDEVEVVSE